MTVGFRGLVLQRWLGNFTDDSRCISKCITISLDHVLKLEIRDSEDFSLLFSAGISEEKILRKLERYIGNMKLEF